MAHASLKEQLQAIASQMSEPLEKGRSQMKNECQIEKAKMPKPKWLDYVHYGVELLKAYFPSSFKATNAVKPLKKGIKQDLVKRLSTMSDIVTEDKACMVKSLAYYVNTLAYHKSVVVGAIRIDLDGYEAGLVSEEEAKYATERHRVKMMTRSTLAQKTKILSK